MNRYLVDEAIQRTSIYAALQVSRSLFVEVRENLEGIRAVSSALLGLGELLELLAGAGVNPRVLHEGNVYVSGMLERVFDESRSASDVQLVADQVVGLVHHLRQLKELGRLGRFSFPHPLPRTAS